MFQLVKEPEAWIDVEWSALDEEGYEQKNTIRMKVVFLPLSNMESLLNGTSEERTVDFAKRVSRDWNQIKGPDGKTFAFKPENLEMLVEHAPGFALGFQQSYNRAWLGQGKVREKNLPGSPADGPAGEAAGTSPAV